MIQTDQLIEICRRPWAWGLIIDHIWSAEARGRHILGLREAGGGRGACFQKACFLLAWPRPAANVVGSVSKVYISLSDSVFVRFLNDNKINISQVTGTHNNNSSLLGFRGPLS
jgi:hypothetical protein